MAGDIEMVIGAKDLATRTLNDVGKQAGDLGKSVRGMSRSATADTKRVEGAFQSLKAAAGPLVAAFAAFKTAVAGFQFFRDSAAAFDVQEEAVRGLTQAIKLNGDTIGPTIEQHEAFASALQNAVNVGDEVTLGLMKQASMLGVSNDKLQDATKAAIGMSEVTGQGLEASLQAVTRAMSGNFSQLERYVPAIREASTEQEKLAIIAEMAGKGMDQQAERALTAAGSAQRLSNTWGDFQEVIGEALAPIRMLINNGLNVLIETIQTAVIPALQAITPSIETVNLWMEKLRAGVITSVTTVEVIVGNLPKIWGIVVDSISLQVVRIIEVTRHAFTEVIPAYARWLGENFPNIFRDAYISVLIITQNFGRNLGRATSAIFDFVRGGMEGGLSGLSQRLGDAMFVGLMDGFEAKTSALPEVAARRITETEKLLAERVGKATDDVMGELREKLAERLGAAGMEGGIEMAKAIDLQLKNIEALKGIGGAGGMGGLASAVQNLSSTESRLLTRGRREGPQQVIDLLGKIEGGIRKLVDNTEDAVDASADRERLQVEIVP